MPNNQAQTALSDAQRNEFRQIVTDVVQLVVPRIIDAALEKKVPALIDAALEQKVPALIDAALEQKVPALIDAALEKKVPVLVEQVVEPYFAAIQADLTELKDNDSSAKDGLVNVDKHHEALKLVVRNHEVRIKKLEPQAA